MTDLPVYVLERLFALQPDTLWRTWTEADLLAQWYGPGVETVIHKLDVRPGGVWLNEMRMKAQSGYQRAEYIEVDPPKRLVMVQSNTDSAWKTMANPGMPDWPKTMLLEVTFEPVGEGTQMQISWSPHDASEAEIACFAGAVEQMGGGWEAGMAALEKLLAELSLS
ncbi:MAG: SRPBCC domain-containing protein [Pseudomonadota bacterium]